MSLRSLKSKVVCLGLEYSGVGALYWAENSAGESFGFGVEWPNDVFDLDGDDSYVNSDPEDVFGSVESSEILFLCVSMLDFGSGSGLLVSPVVVVCSMWVAPEAFSSENISTKDLWHEDGLLLDAKDRRAS